MARAKANVEEATEKGPSKMNMVRDALRDLGNDAKPKAIYDYVLEKFGVELPTPMISSYKSSIIGKDPGRSGSFRVSRGAASGNVSLNDLEQVQTLIDRVGAPQLQQLIRVLSK